MRDHPGHWTPILGGGWGCKMTDVTRFQWKNAWSKGFADKLLWADRSKRGPDQTFLTKYVTCIYFN